MTLYTVSIIYYKKDGSGIIKFFFLNCHAWDTKLANTIWFSLRMLIHFSSIVRCTKLGLICSIFLYIVLRSPSYNLHLLIKWNSSSISPLSQNLHSRSSGLRFLKQLNSFSSLSEPVLDWASNEHGFYWDWCLLHIFHWIFPI